MPKRGIKPSNLLLEIHGKIERIDERTETTQEDVRNIKLKQGKLFDEFGAITTRVSIIEDKDRNRVHIPKNGNPMGKIIFTILRIFR